MRALVTGAAGFVGSNLALALSAQGADVVGLDDFSVGHFKNLQDFRGDMIGVDLRRIEQWEGRLGKIDVIFHQAAVTDTTATDQLRMMQINVEAFRALMDFAARRKVKKVVYASSAAVYGDGGVPMRESARPRPLNIYAFSKHVMEQVARRFPKVESVGLRYFNVFGPGESFKGAAASMIWQLSRQMLSGNRPRIFEFGQQYRDFVYVKDVVAANLAAAERKVSGVFNVCTGKKTTFNEIIEALNATLGSRLEPDYFKNPYSFYQNETLGDPSLAARQLKFSARYGVKEGIADYFKGLAAPAAAGV